MHYISRDIGDGLRDILFKTDELSLRMAEHQDDDIESGRHGSPEYF